jgi:hypothetical protein
MESIVSLEIHAILTVTLGEHAPSHATVKTWVAQFKCGDFSTFFPGRAKDLSAPRYNATNYFLPYTFDFFIHYLS